MTETARGAVPALDAETAVVLAQEIARQQPADRPPTVDDARRAADALIGAGAGQVWLYGSVARGESHRRSDIDLVAVFDDLEYRRRVRTTIELQRLAERACGYRVQVLATDRPEWRIQQEEVSASFASAISCDLRLLACSTESGAEVDWDKEQTAATSNEELAVERLESVLVSLDKVNANRDPSSAEQESADSGDASDYLEARGARLIVVCEAAAMAIENGAKAVGTLTGAPAPTLWSHNIDKIVDSLGPDDAEAMRALISSAPDLVKSAGYITMWRTIGVYGTPGEGLTVYEVASPEFAAAIAEMACKVAVHAVERAAGLIPPNRLQDKLRRRSSTVQGHFAAYDIGTGRPKRPSG